MEANKTFNSLDELITYIKTTVITNTDREITEQIMNNILLGITAFQQGKLQIITSIAEGATIAPNEGVSDLVIDTATTILNATIKLPPSPYEGQSFRILFGGQISSTGKMIVNALTIDGNGNTIVESAPAGSVRSGDSLEYKFVNNYWRGF